METLFCIFKQQNKLTICQERFSASCRWFFFRSLPSFQDLLFNSIRCITFQINSLCSKQQVLVVSLDVSHFPHLTAPSPQSSACSPVSSHQGTSGSEAPPSPPGLQTSPLLSRFASADVPVPSPRCPSLSHSLRYNLDPDAAPSPPCSQHIRV